ncbi:MAG: hypothetical protein H6715_00780 [Myxococcales bacterium]|nr:hypothetical protein [Myxococcales bacterium]MCB9708034.1 hypothetical protein [Myxococcales bacterium]
MTHSKVPPTSELDFIDVEDLKSGTRRSEHPGPPPPPKRAVAAPLKRPIAHKSPAQLRHPVPAPRRPPLESQRPTREDVSQIEAAQISSRPLAQHAKALIQHFDAELRYHPTAEQTARLHYEMGRLFETRLDNPARALEHYQKAQQAVATFIPALRDARRLLIRHANYRDALAFFDAEIAATSHPRSKTTLLYQKGLLLEERLLDVDHAQQSYLDALSLSPEDHSLLNGLARCFRHHGNWDELAQVYERRASIARDDSLYKGSQLFLRAKLAEHQQGNVNVAMEFYQAALLAHPAHRGAIAALTRLYHSHRRWHELCEMLSHDAEQTNDPKIKCTNWIHIAHISLGQLKDKDRAAEALKMASSVSGDDPIILHRLAVLYESAGLYKDAVATWSLWVDAETDNPDIVDIATHIGRIAELQLEQEELAIQWYERALHTKPDNDQAFHSLSELYRRRNDWDGLIGINLQLANTSHDPARRAHAHASVADILETKLGELDDAIEQHLRALSLVPAYDPSMKALDRLFRLTGKFGDLIHLHERAFASAPDNQRRVAMLFAIGGLYEVHLKDYEYAIQTYKRILKIEADNLNAIHALQRSAENHHDYETVVSALAMEATVVTENRARIELHQRIAEIQAVHVADPTEAIREYERVLELDPRYLPAIHGLRALYQREGRFDDMLSTYERELESIPDAKKQAELYHQVGRIQQERLGKAEDAAKSYKMAVDRNPAHAASLTALEGIYRAKGDWALLADVLAIRLEHCTKDTEKAFAALEIGEIYEERLNNRKEAAKAYEAALSHKPSLYTARAALVRLHQEAEEWTPLIEDLKRITRSVTDEDLKVEVLLQQGDVWNERLKNSAEAIACVEAALQEKQQHLDAFDALESLYHQSGEKVRLITLYTQWVSALSDPSIRVAQWRELARVSLGDAFEDGPLMLAKQSANEVLKVFPEDEAALLLLEQVALEANDPDLLTDIEGFLSKITATPDSAAVHLLRLAEALESLAHPDAVNVFRAAAKKDPRNLGALHGFARLADSQTDPTFQIEAKRLLAEASLDPEQAAGYLVDSARLHMDQLENPVEALRDLRHALRILPSHPAAIDRLEQVLSGAGQHAQLAETLGELATAIVSPSAAAEVWMRVARIYSERLDDVPAAIGALDKAVSAAPDHLEAIMALAMVLKADRQWQKATELLKRGIVLSKDPAMLLECHMDVAELSVQWLEAAPAARLHVEAALHIDPNHTRALALLAELQLAAGERTNALGTASRLARIARDPHDKAIALGCLGKLHLAEGHADKALHCYIEALSLGGPEDHILPAFKQLVQEAGRWDYYVSALEAFLKQSAEDSPYLATAYRELAWVYHQKFERIDSAIDTLKIGIARTHGDIGLRKNLVQRLREANNFAEAVQELHHILKSDVTLSDMWRELAKLYLATERSMEARLATQPLLVLGTATSSDIELAQFQPPRPADGLAAAFSQDRVQTIAQLPPHTRAATQLLRAIRSGIGKIFLPDFDGYGNWEKVSLRAEKPLVQLVKKVADVLDVHEFDLYIHGARGRGVGIELGDPSVLMVPADIEEHTVSKQAFLIAQALSKIGLELEATAKLMPRELQILLAAASRNVAPEFGAGLTNDEIIDDQSKKLNRALSRKARKIMDEAASAYVAGQPVDFLDWAHAIEQAACRIAALISDDLPGSVEIIRRSRRELNNLHGTLLVHQCDEVRDLMEFWTSDVAMQARRAMGLI